MSARVERLWPAVRDKSEKALISDRRLPQLTESSRNWEGIYWGEELCLPTFSTFMEKDADGFYTPCELSPIHFPAFLLSWQIQHQQHQ